jgi:hypothetical protein
MVIIFLNNNCMCFCSFYNSCSRFLFEEDYTTDVADDCCDDCDLILRESLYIIIRVVLFVIFFFKDNKPPKIRPEEARMTPIVGPDEWLSNTNR